MSADGSLVRAIRQQAPGAMPVRVVAFNKSESANWGVPWHQDRVIAVAERSDVTGYHNWTKKSGTWHCEPPQSVLDQMLFVRVHLDDTDRSNGAMEIALGSHAGGVVPSAKAESAANSYPTEICEAKRGDVLILKMLTLHCSKPAQRQSGRRVLRVDFSCSELPHPLSWLGQAAEV
ncbi:phytanoyl-CoA dioxygenase family protein [Gymnodinialimonas sp.]